MVGDQHFRRGQVHAVVHIAPSRSTGREIEDYKVALVLRSSFIGPSNGTVYVETLIRAVILRRVL